MKERVEDHDLHGNAPDKAHAALVLIDLINDFAFEDDYFVLKPKHSGFYSTTLDLLLAYLQVKTLARTASISTLLRACRAASFEKRRA